MLAIKLHTKHFRGLPAYFYTPVLHGHHFATAGMKHDASMLLVELSLDFDKVAIGAKEGFTSGAAPKQSSHDLQRIQYGDEPSGDDCLL